MRKRPRKSKWPKKPNKDVASHDAYLDTDAHDANSESHQQDVRQNQCQTEEFKLKPNAKRQRDFQSDREERNPGKASNMQDNSMLDDSNNSNNRKTSRDRH